MHIAATRRIDQPFHPAPFCESSLASDVSSILDSPFMPRHLASPLTSTCVQPPTILRRAALAFYNLRPAQSIRASSSAARIHRRRKTSGRVPLQPPPTLCRPALLACTLSNIGRRRSRGGERDAAGKKRRRGGQGPQGEAGPLVPGAVGVRLPRVSRHLSFV